MVAVFVCNVFAIDVLLRTLEEFFLDTFFQDDFGGQKCPDLEFCDNQTFTAQNAAEVSQDTASWIQTLKSLAWGLAGRGLAKEEAILQF